jgi:outer membrane protein assembly factor BamB
MTSTERFSAEFLRRCRRILTAGTFLLIGLTFVGPVSSVVAQTLDPPRATASGVVFEDRDADGEQDAGEKGVEGVSVSDGATIVQTNAAGRYELETNTERRINDIVFITQPAGYTVPTDEFMTPRFYRDLGELADGAEQAVDFALVADPTSRSANFSFANIADPHINPQLPEQIREINSTESDLGFIQVSGDLTNQATDAEFDRYKSSTAASELPVWPAVGNHEYSGGSSYAARINNYRRHVGPEWYSFDYGNRHFLVLENNGAAPFDEQLAWAEADLEAAVADNPDTELVVLTHQPMNVPFGSPSQYDRFGELLERFGAELILVGHEHSNDVEPDSDFAAGAKHIQTTSSSYSIDTSPRGFRYVHMQGDGFENPFRRYGVDRSVTITNPPPGTEVPRASFTGIQVNAYDTSDEVERVRYRLDGGSWKNLKPTGDVTWYAPWTGRLPALGEHTVEVEVTDAGGATWDLETATFTLSAEAPVIPRAGDDWAQHHGDPAHAGVAADELDPGLRLAWSYRTPGTFLVGSPVIVDGVVYAGTRDENGEGNAKVHAVELATGEQLWEFEVPSSIHGTPAVADRTVFVPSLRGTLFALDATTGELRWQRDPEPSGNEYNQRSYSYYSPAVADGKVYWAYQTRYNKASQGLLVALDTVTGDTVWEAPMTGSTMSDGTPTVADGRVYVGNQTASRVIAYDAATGARQWVSSAALGGWQDGIPTAAGGRVFIGSGNGIVARDAATGQDLWTYRSPHPSKVSSNSTPSAAAVEGDTVYMGFPSGAVTALDASTGAVLWDRLLPGGTYDGGVHSSPVVSGETLFVGANNGFLYALDRLTGQPLWDYEVGTWVAAGPAVSGNALVAGAWDGNLYAFTPGGESAERWARVTGTVTDAGEPVPGARVTASQEGAAPVVTSTDDDGRYVLGLEQPGTYTVTATKRGYLPTDGSTGSVDVDSTGEETLDLELDEVTEPVAGTSSTPPDFGPGSTRLDMLDGDTYHYVMNDRVQATISSRVGANNQAGTFQPGWLADIALTDSTAMETLDWSELILAPTMNDPKRPWGRSGEWLSLGDIGVDGDSVVASGTAQVDESLETSIRYRALPDAPVVKATLEVTNTGTEDFAGYFQYLLDPDSSDDTAYVPGVAGTNPGFITSGWTGNHLYVGPKTQNGQPAHGIAWVDDEPTGLSAFGYIAGAWFDASVAAGETTTISWYHITDYAGAGHPTANIARWGSQLDVLDDEVADRSRIAGTVTYGDTGEPAAGVRVEVMDGAGAVVASGWAGEDGGYSLTVEPGDYTVRASALGYATASEAAQVDDGATTEVDLVLDPVTVSASTGKRLSGGLVEGGAGDVVMENDRLAMAIAKVFDDAQLRDSTTGKPVDMAVRGRDDQIDWFNLPYVTATEPTGTEAWQVRTVRNETVEIVQASGDQAVVRVTGTSSEQPDLAIITSYTIRPDEEWITAETVFENRGSSTLSVWLGDAIDHDGAGQRSGVAGHGSITTPYGEPQAYEPTGRWIGMTGTDPQTYGLIYDPANDDFTAYGNGNWIMSKHHVDIAAGDSHTLSRRIVAASNQGDADPFDVLDELAVAG